MFPELPLERISKMLGDALAEEVSFRRLQPVAGGSINRAYRASTATRDFFIKCHQQDRLSMFEAEAEGLAELRRADCVRVPRVYACGGGDGVAWLVLEWLPAIPGGERGAAQLGERLAALHRVHTAHFGWHRDNTIGLTPQRNAWDDDWPRFFRDQRLGFQLQLAERQRLDRRLQRLGERLLPRIAEFFTDYRPRPSLLHGDLWGGNWHLTTNDEPVLFDPAVYYGDREADLAMTELFGGFPSAFYQAYRANWPLDAGYSVRRTLYNLYHVLNHANMFGGGYVRQACAMMESLLAELG
ncbi:MAG: fructosamine kinase family protein [Zetaproteobacteria bacterium]|nr:MAG: fructosamine kinase family protein [Zetaproteobacteria bacterium]